MFLPNKVSAFGAPAAVDDESVLPPFRGKKVLGGKATIYVCENSTCKLPTNDLAVAKKWLQQNGPEPIQEEMLFDPICSIYMRRVDISAR